jgi:hypothetical protein
MRAHSLLTSHVSRFRSISLSLSEFLTTHVSRLTFHVEPLTFSLLPFKFSCSIHKQQQE